MSRPSGADYDVVVVGSGLGGISAAALLARSGKRVLVVERTDAAGGYAHAFRRGAYTFDPAVHAVPEREFLTNVLTYAGVQNRVELLPVESLFSVAFPELRHTFPLGTDAVVSELAGLHPGESDAIRDFFGLRDRIFREASQLPHQLGVGALDAAAERFPTFFKFRSATLQEAVESHLRDPKLQALCASMWPYVGPPPSRCGFLYYVQVLGALSEGTYYARGGFQSLVDAFVAAVEDAGGEVVFGREATRIDVDGDAVRGVELAGGDTVSARAVISNADATHTLTELVGRELLPAAYVSKLERLTPGVSAFSVYTATTLDLAALGAGHETFVYRHWDHEASFRDVLDGRPGGMWMSIPSLVDPSLAPPGEHTVILTSLARYDAYPDWDAEADRFSELLVDELETLFPGYRDSMTLLVPATPLTLQRRAGTRDGAAYGWEMTPRQTAGGRLPHETPIKRLYLSGAWTQQGHGCLRTIVSGEQVARRVLAALDGSDGLPSFRPSHLPPLST